MKKTDVNLYIEVKRDNVGYFFDGDIREDRVHSNGDIIPYIQDLWKHDSHNIHIS